MRNSRPPLIFAVSLLVVLTACKKKDEKPATEESNKAFFSEYDSRSFKMGFTTWPYAATTEAVNGTDQFITNHADIYSEHIDASIPWDAWINDTQLPLAFTNDITARASRSIAGAKKTVSVSLLNSSRNDLATDYDGKTPNYSQLNDSHIEDAYFKHLQYITNQLNPDYLLLAIEVNELLKNAPDKWPAYKLLMSNIKIRMKQEFPSLPISESLTLHNFYQADVPDPDAFVQEIANYANAMEFVTISFYPFFNGLSKKEEFQQAFDFLHEKVNKPMAMAETAHLSEDLEVASFNLFIQGNQSEQNEYLETLLINAQHHDFEYLIWWAHRDYDELWQTFPDEVKDLGKLWISTGLINEDGMEKEAFDTWKLVFKK